MANLMVSLLNASQALGVYSKALDVTQNNVANASTPGFARQQQELIAAPYEPGRGDGGGVRAGQVRSARNLYAEQSVRQRVSAAGRFDQKAQSLAMIEGEFDISGKTGVPAALNALFQSFSAWSVEPEGSGARQNVIDRAADLAAAMRSTSSRLDADSADLDRGLRDTVNTINRLAASIHGYNVEIQQGGQHDAGLDAKKTAALEELAEYVDFTALHEPDGTVTVLMGGETPLVIGEKQYALPPPDQIGIPPRARLLDAAGKDITAQVSGGRLAGLLEVRNDALPDLRARLNLLSKTVADRINQVLAGGQFADGTTPTVSLFEYASDDSAAASLRVSPAMSADQLAPVDAGPPRLSNGIALKLSALSDPRDAADMLLGMSFHGFYGDIAARAGRELAEARDGSDLQQGLVGQARALRSELSGVSLDEEAVTLMEFQRAYQATSRLIGVLDDLTEEAINLIH